MIDQQPIAWDLPHNGTRTSRAAAESAKLRAPSACSRILAFVDARGLTGATIDEISCALDILTQTVCARMNDLKGKGYQPARIYDSKRERPTRTGRSAIVWCAVAVKAQA